LKRRPVVFSPEARRDLFQLFDWIAERAGEDIAAGYIERLEAYCLKFEVAPHRGRRRSDIRPGLRIIGFERRVTIAFVVEAEAVLILRLYYGGRNWG
jgi:toxin ParE1/3/4